MVIENGLKLLKNKAVNNPKLNQSKLTGRKILTYSLIHRGHRPGHFSIQRSDGENICPTIEEVTDLKGGETRTQSL